LSARQPRVRCDLYDEIFLVHEAPMPASNIKAAASVSTVHPRFSR
jgi:hypothetical protein